MRATAITTGLMGVALLLGTGAEAQLRGGVGGPASRSWGSSSPATSRGTTGGVPAGRVAPGPAGSSTTTVTVTGGASSPGPALSSTTTVIVTSPRVGSPAAASAATPSSTIVVQPGAGIPRGLPVGPRSTFVTIRQEGGTTGAVSGPLPAGGWAGRSAPGDQTIHILSTTSGGRHPDTRSDPQVLIVVEPGAGGAGVATPIVVVPE